MVYSEPKVNVEIPVPSNVLNDPNLVYAINWDNDDDDESLALSYRAGRLLDSDEMKTTYISGQKQLLQYDVETVEDMKRKISDEQREINERSDSEEELAVSIAVAEALEESIRRDELPISLNNLNDSDAVQN